MPPKDYLTTIHKYINHMSPSQLNTLYNLHSDLFIKSKMIRIPTTYYNHDLKDLTYYKIKHYTPKSQYSSGTKFLISFSLSIIILRATD